MRPRRTTFTVAAAAIALLAAGCSDGGGKRQGAIRHPQDDAVTGTAPQQNPGSERARATTTETKPGSKADKKSRTAKEATFKPPPVKGTRLRDAHYKATVSAWMSLKEVDFNNRTAEFHLRRGVEGPVTHLQWSRPDGSELDMSLYDVTASPEGPRGFFQARAGGGFAPCTWDTRPLLLVPLNPKAGDVFKEQAACHSDISRFTFDQELRVIGPTTATVDGVEVPAWRLRRVVNYTLRGGNHGEAVDESDEVWLIDEPLLVSAVGHNKGQSRSISTRQESEFHLLRTLPPS